MLYKDLTPEQQEHLHNTFDVYGVFPEDATHIDLELDAEDDAASLLKLVGTFEYHLFSGKDVWYRTDNTWELSTNTYEIPEDFCRVTGKILPSSEEDTFPDFSFKVSCGDRPEVRQWLKDNGCRWHGSLNTDLTKDHIDCKFLYVYDIGIVTCSDEDNWKVLYKDWPVVEPTIKVTGYTLTESSKAHKQTLDKLSELRNNAEEIQKQIEELEKTL